MPKNDSARDPAAQAVIDFWRTAGPGAWFAKNKKFDQEFAGRFQHEHFQAARRELEHWLDQPYDALALILLLDQYPRNAYRNTAHMFACDGLALHYARQSLRHLSAIEYELRNFLCLPFMHSEDLATQEEALQLYREHVPDSLPWAIEHHRIIMNFGRFPHRNPLLGRQTTKAEQEYLDSGGFAG